MVKGRTLDETLKLMRKRQGDRTMSQYALDLGVTQGYISEIYRKRRNPGTIVLEDLGLKQVIIYVNCDNETPELKATTRNLQASAF